MKKILVTTEVKKLLADVYTPVGIYLRFRDKFRDTILLESTDHHVAENSFSFICINAIAGIEISTNQQVECKLPGEKPEKIPLSGQTPVQEVVWNFMQRFEVAPVNNKTVKSAQGFFGYTAYDAIPFFDTITFKNEAITAPVIPLMRYRFYQYIIIINHFNDELFLCENKIQGIESEVEWVESLLKSKDIPVFPFAVKGNETSNISDEAYIAMVKSGIQHCLRGDVFQIVLSRRFQQTFIGDEFNVYRALRSINPSPYLFFFDYGDYKLMGSSPEAQLIIKNGKAVVHPIAGTFKRTGNDAVDAIAAEKLLLDAKENAEHVMLVDLARNDLSRLCTDVTVSHFRQIHYYSHVIHLVSEVTGKIAEGANPFILLAKTFPAGTLSGAPKFKAMGLIDDLETTSRSYYGGALGFIGFDGSCNHAIMIRTFLSKNNTLFYQAGAGVVAASNPESELQEVNNKLGALKKAVEYAITIL
ncbi:MAG: anthranilate synthase component I family protein [Sphingobacteriales bacterium]|uniref:anthranilate synthase component I family protein n=1 Tax=Hydrotalea flava TaxID=714549 RepID=UPI00082A4F56|nr:anthranilate synthase component I family protein [Hydrotalea flava]RTL56691.1 MAG: anthranilate synthase component I family protein [Sphingobacteriales bacterium]